MESLIKKIEECKNNLAKSSATKVIEHTPCRYLMVWTKTIWIFDDLENTQNFYRGDYYIKKFCQSLMQHEMKIINFDK